MSIDKRRFGRRTVFKPARLVIENDIAVPCIIVDESEGGARIQVALDRDPSTVLLVIPEEELWVSCAVRHRSAAHMGLEYMTWPRSLRKLRARQPERYGAWMGVTEIRNRPQCGQQQEVCEARINGAMSRSTATGHSSN